MCKLRVMGIKVDGSCCVHCNDKGSENTISEPEFTEMHRGRAVRAGAGRPITEISGPVGVDEFLQAVLHRGGQGEGKEAEAGHTGRKRDWNGFHWGLRAAELPPSQRLGGFREPSQLKGPGQIRMSVCGPAGGVTLGASPQSKICVGLWWRTRSLTPIRSPNRNTSVNPV